MSEENIPPVRDVKDYKFQQLCKVQVRNAVQSDEIKGPYSLIDSSSKYGLTFVGIQNGFKVIRTHEFIAQDKAHASDRLQHIITDIPTLATVDLGQQVTHLSLSCDGLTLAVCIVDNGGSSLRVYDVRRFVEPITTPVPPFLDFKLGGGGGVVLSDMAWNPAQPSLLVVCTSNGQLEMLNIATKLDVRASKPAARAKCVCWSPKGKQLVVGIEGGQLVQYDYNLDVKRVWDCPPIFPDQSFSAISLVWLSTYTFLAGYMSSQAASSDQPNLVLVNGSKEGQPSYENFEDICFGTGEERPKKYFFNFIQQWEMVVTGSSNASEIAVMAKHLDQKQTWEQWTLDDAGRAECPLTADYVDTYPLGITVDYSSQIPIPLDDERSHPPSPLMLILSTAGFIIPYHCMYLHREAQAITAPAEVLSNTGCRQAVGGPIPTAQPTKAFGGPPTAAKNLFGTGTSTAKPSFGAGILPTPTDAANKPVSGIAFGGTPEIKSPFSGFGQTEGQPFATKFTAPAPASQSDNAGLVSGKGTGSFSFVPANPTLPGASTSQPAPSFTAAPASAPSTGFGGFGGFASATPGTTATFGSSGSGSTPTFGSAAPVSGSTPTFGSLSSTSGATSTFGSLGSALGGSTTFGALSAASGSTPTFGSLGSSTGPAPSFGSSATSSGPAPTFGALSTSGTTPTFGSLGLSQKPAVPSTATSQAPSIGFGLSQTSGSDATSFSFKPTNPVVADAIGTGISTSSMTVPGSFSFTTKSSGPPTGLNNATSAPTNTGTGLPSKPATGPLGQPSQNAYNPSGPSLTSGLIGALGQRSSSGSSGSLHKSTTLASLSQGEPEGTAEGNLQRSSTFAPPPSYPTSAPPPSYPTSAPPPAYTSHQSTKRGATQEPTTEGEGESPADDTVDRSFAKSIQEEMLHFERELIELKTRAGRTDFEIGARDDMVRLRKKTEEMGKFCDEIKKTVKEQSKDVEEQTTLCLDMFSMVEECRVRQQLNSDPKYKTLLKSRALDSASAERLQQLQLQNQALDQGLRDVDLILDTQWEDYQSRKKNQSRRIQAPTNDAIYRVVKSNHNLILAQKSKLKDVEERLKQLKLYNKTSTWNNTTYSAGESDVLSSLADSLVEPRPTTSGSQTSIDSGSLRDYKLAQLRDHLYRRHVPVIRSTRPENLSMSRLTIPDTAGLVRSPQKSPEKPRVTQTAGRGSTREEAPVVQGSKTFTGLSMGATSTGTKPPPQVPQKPNKPVTAPKPVSGANGKTTGAFTTGAGSSPFAFNQQPTSFGQAQFNVGQNTGQAFQGFGMGAGKGDFTGPKLKEINGIRLEDITPSGSENEVETTEEDEDEEYDEDSSESNEQGFAPQGFAPQYNVTGSQITSTPMGFKPPTEDPVTPKMTSASTPVSRKLFGQEDSQPASGFQFGGGGSQTSGFGFGNLGTLSGKQTSASATTTTTASLSAGSTLSGSGITTAGNKPAAKGFNFTASQPGKTDPPASTKSSVTGDTGFQFGGGAGGSGFNFGSAETKPASASTGMTGLFGSKTSGPTTSGSQPTVTDNKGFTFAAVTTSSSAATSGPQVAVVSASSSSSGGSAPSFNFGGSSASTQSFGGSAPTSSKTAVVHPSTVEDSPAGVTATPSSLASAPVLFGNGGLSTASSSTTTGTSQSGASTQPSTFSFGQSEAATQPSSFSFGQSGVSSSQSGTPQFDQTASSSSATSTTGLFGKPVTADSSVASTGGQTTTISGDGSQTQPKTGGTFGTSTSTPGSSFGQPATSSTGLFGQTATNSSTGLFGQPTTAATTSTTGLFGQTATTSSTGLFGQPASTSSTGLFGQAATTSSTGLFGQPATTSSTGLFGQPATTSSTGLFGQPATTSSTGLFGQPATTSSTGLFGQPATTSSTGLFGQPATTSSTGLFGQQTTASSTGLFGQTATTSSSGLFGQTASTASSGLFGQTAATSSTGLFGQPASPSSSTGLFGQTSAPGTGLFGSPSSDSGTSTFGQSSFGQTSSSGFGQTGSSSGGLFGKPAEESGSGGFFGGLGGKPSAEKANTNVFGTTSFGSQAQTSNSGLFGSGSSTLTFGSANSTGGGGAFTGGGGGVGSTGFGTSQQPTSGSGFGGSGFGGSPAFGGAPAFGSPPRFGVAPAMGSGSSFGAQPTFGAASPLGGGGGAPTFGGASTLGGGTFGSANASPAAGFAGFASAGSPTFGALAQATGAPSFDTMNPAEPTGFGSPAFGGGQQNPPAFGGSTFGSSPQFTGYRG